MRVESMPAGKPRLGLIFGGVTAVVAVASVAWLSIGLPLPGCVFHSLSGLPCPACGSTRMAFALASGRVGEAFLWNPLVFACGVAFLAWVGAGLVAWLRREPERTLVPSPAEARMLRLGVVAVVLLNWSWLLARGV